MLIMQSSVQSWKSYLRYGANPVNSSQRGPSSPPGTAAQTEGSALYLYTTKHKQSPLRVITVVIFHMELVPFPNSTKEKGGLYFSHRDTQTQAYTRGPTAAALSAIDQPVTRNIACLFSSPRSGFQAAACKKQRPGATQSRPGSKAGRPLLGEGRAGPPGNRVARVSRATPGRPSAEGSEARGDGVSVLVPDRGGRTGGRVREQAGGGRKEAERYGPRFRPGRDSISRPTASADSLLRRRQARKRAAGGQKPERKRAFFPRPPGRFFNGESSLPSPIAFLPREGKRRERGSLRVRVTGAVPLKYSWLTARNRRPPHPPPPSAPHGAFSGWNGR